MPTLTQDIVGLIRQQREFFSSGATLDAEVRRKQLKQMHSAIEAYEERLLSALYQDLRKPATEAYFSEIGTVYEEIKHALKHFESWMRPERVTTPLLQAPSSAYIQAEPYGVTTVIAPWNYPVQLLLIPAIGALAAGNTVLLKPSEFVPHTSTVLAKMIGEYFEPQWVALIEGAVDETQALLKEKLDYIFFTGSPAVGKIIMRQAADHLTPVTLELGGKSPAIIDAQTNLDTSVKRLIWGKCFNLGQTCVAPDYALVPTEQKEEIFDLMRKHLYALYGNNPQQSPDLARMVNRRHFDRVSEMIEGKVVIGGQTDAEDLYIAPTVIEVDDAEGHPAMQEEIFGPVLPVLTYDYLHEAISFVNERPKPLALYLFSTSSRHQNRVLQETSSGGVCVNDTIVHLSMAELPFGGVGNSGMGNYHGKRSFDTFSHQKSVMKRGFLFDPAVRYAPYKTSLGLIRDLMKWFG